MAGTILDYISKGTGAPSGSPAVGTGESSRYLNTTNNHEYAWDGSAWQDVTGSGGGGGSSVTQQSAHLTTDVAISSGNTYVDVLTLSLVAGTYLLMASVTATASAANQQNARISDGSSSHVASTQSENEGSGGSRNMALVGTIVVSTTTTYKLQVADQSGFSTVKAATSSNASGNTATSFVALKIA